MHCTQYKVRVCRFWGSGFWKAFSSVNGHSWPWAAPPKQATFYQISTRKQATGWEDFFSKSPAPALAIRVAPSTCRFQWITCAWVSQIWIPHGKAKPSVTIKTTTMRDDCRMPKYQYHEKWGLIGVKILIWLQGIQSYFTSEEPQSALITKNK